MAKTYGDWRCTNCDNIEQKEREVICWKCGKGEMVFTPFKPKLCGAERDNKVRER